MQRIQTISSYLIWVFTFLLIALPLWALFQWVFIEWQPIQNLMLQGFISKSIETPEGLVNLAQLKFTPLSWSIGLCGIIIGSAPVFLGLLIIRKLFQNYHRSHIFSLENAQKYKYLTWLFFLDALFIKPISNMLMILSATLSNPPGHRYISLSFGTPNLEVLFYGMLAIIISWIMVEGYKLQEEKNLTI